MAGGKGKSTGGKAGPKDDKGKSQQSHSAKAGLQVSNDSTVSFGSSYTICDWNLGNAGLDASPLDLEPRLKILNKYFPHNTSCV